MTDDVLEAIIDHIKGLGYKARNIYHTPHAFTFYQDRKYFLDRKPYSLNIDIQLEGTNLHVELRAYPSENPGGSLSIHTIDLTDPTSLDQLNTLLK